MITKLRIDGMTCNHCVRAIEGAVRAVPGVRTVTVELASHRATVDHDPEAASIERIAAAIEQAGYTSELAT